MKIVNTHYENLNVNQVVLHYILSRPLFFSSRPSLK